MLCWMSAGDMIPLALRALGMCRSTSEASQLACFLKIMSSSYSERVPSSALE